jgi:hypothetical protein
VGELAAESAPELQALRRPVLLVAQSEKHRLQRLWDANKEALTECRRGVGKRRKVTDLGMFSVENGLQNAPRHDKFGHFPQSKRRLHNRRKPFVVNW